MTRTSASVDLLWTPDTTCASCLLEYETWAPFAALKSILSCQRCYRILRGFGRTTCVSGPHKRWFGTGGKSVKSPRGVRQNTRFPSIIVGGRPLLGDARSYA